MNRPPHRALDVGALRAFEAVARRLSFSAAAEELFLTQPAISRQIKALETGLGAPLFVRGTRKVELSQAGALLQRSVLPLLQRLDTTVRQIRSARGRRHVAISTFASFASLWLLPRLAAFERAHPDIDIRISASDTMIDLGDSDIDLVLRYCRPGDAAPGATLLFDETIAPVIGRTLADLVARGQAPRLVANQSGVSLTITAGGHPRTVKNAAQAPRRPRWIFPPRPHSRRHSGEPSREYRSRNESRRAPRALPQTQNRAP